MKPSLRPAVVLTLAFVLPLSVSAPAAELALPTPGALTCQGPIRPGDTAASLKARYGAAAEVVTVDGPEGQPTQVLMLWGQDKRLRMEVRFWDDAMTRLAAVQPYADSQWTIAGLAVGDPYQKVEKLNGRPFRFSGFDWDYGGYVTTLGGGKLAALPGGCSVSIRLALPEGESAPDRMLGDRTLSSRDRALRQLKPLVDELSLGWPAPKELP